ncbi:MAG: tRNA adenosine(34) deaminase TadA [Christensenellaceae bacterium]|jgi:tRNA(adenine34) deaminase|nr:tRNA adenosine(34) deaminase TadA [Christensenellaceae bacterium]
MDNEKFMRLALKEAERAVKEDEVPVGAVIVIDGEIIATAHNKKEQKNDPTAHAEIEVIRKACKKIGNWHLDKASIYVTLEPCAMCAGAILNARIRHLYFGAWDIKAGCCGTLLDIPGDGRFNHETLITGGILRDECAHILSDYFKNKRMKSTC